MADKRISQLAERTDIANNDVLAIVASGATVTNKATISSIQSYMQTALDVGVTSVGVTLGSSGTDVSVTGSPITTSGNITINIPSASATARGLVTTEAQTFAGAKTFDQDIFVNGIKIGRGGGDNNSNTVVGGSSGDFNTTGAFNSFFGAASGGSNSTGSLNTFVGANSGTLNTIGASNTFLGNASGVSNIEGSFNVFLGSNAAFSFTTGQGNTFVGQSVGNNISDNTPLTSATNSVFVGGAIKANANSETNQIVIGHNAIGNGSNTVTIGNSSTTDNYFNGTVRSTALRLAEAGTADTTIFRNTSGTNSITANTNVLGFNNVNNIFVTTESRGGFILGFNNTVSNREYTLQDASGTLAFTSDIPSLAGYVTLDTVQTITAQKTFTTSGGDDTLIVNHTSGSGIALDIAKAGNGEGLRVVKTSGSGNAVTITGGNLEAPAIVRTGGTSSQFLKADGSVDSSTYLTTGSAASTYLPLVGGTLTGTLEMGTSAPSIFLRGANSGLKSIQYANSGGSIHWSLQTSLGASGEQGTFSIRNGVLGTDAIVIQPASNNITFNNSITNFLGSLSGTGCFFSSDIQTGTRLIAANPSGEIRITPNLSGTTNRIESFGSLPFSLTSVGAITLAAGGTTPQITLATDGAATLTGALNGTSASFNDNLVLTGASKQVRLENSSFVNFTNSGNTVQRGYIQHDGSNLNIASSVGTITLINALNGTSAVFNHNDAPTIRVQRNGGTDSNTVLEFTNATRSFFIGSNGAEMGLGGTSGSISTQPLKIAHSTGAATFSSSVTANGLYANAGNSARFYRGANDFYWSINNDSNNFLNFGTFEANGTAYGSNPKMILQDDGNVGIGTASPAFPLDVETGSGRIQLRTGAATGGTGGGNGIASVNSANNALSDLNIRANIITLITDSTERMRITSGGVVHPGADNTQTLGSASFRWSEVFAGNATINTSDATEKQDIEELNEAEKQVAKALKGLIRKYRWIDSVERKGDEARIHVGVMAQDVAQAFTDNGLDAERYGVFCKDVWYTKEETYTEQIDNPEFNDELEEGEGNLRTIEGDEKIRTVNCNKEDLDATEHTLMGVRYDQLWAFIISAL